MRISAELAGSLVNVLSEQLRPDPGSTLFLFGSRADPHKKGGDIDLLLITNSRTKDRAKPILLKLKAGLREAAQDQRVDLSVATEEQMQSDPFFSLIENKILLKKW